jgi:transcriptional regulator with XRE-family HTH domain
MSTHITDATPVAVPQWDIADRMRKSLRAAGLSVNDVAEYFGVNRNTVSAWINGRVTPAPPMLRLWAVRTAVPYCWLVEGIDPDHEPPHPPGLPNLRSWDYKLIFSDLDAA